MSKRYSKCYELRPGLNRPALLSLFLMFLFLTSLYTLLILFWPDLFPFSDFRLVIFVIAAAICSTVCLVAFDYLLDPWARFVVGHLAIKFGPKYEGSLSPLAYHYRLSNAISEGHIYLIRRITDGIYKVGASKQFKSRLKQLIRDYGPVHLVALWEVPSVKECEIAALQMTENYHYPEYGRVELRQMTDDQALSFIGKFTAYISELDHNPKDELEPDATEAKILELAEDGLSKSAIARQIFGHDGGNQLEKIKDILGHQ